MKRRSFLSFLLTATGSAALEAQGRSLLGIPPRPPLNAGSFFDDGVLHEVRLVVNSDDWASLKEHYLDNTYYPCDFRWRDQVVRSIGIRSRGNVTRSPIKPSLRVDFNRYSSDREFLGLKSFVLRSNIFDPSYLRERLSMLVYRRMGFAAPREAHTTLYLNNEYIGLYTMVESVDKVFLRRAFNNDEGYLYDYDHQGIAYYFEFRGPDPGLYVPIPFQPQTHESDDPRPEVIEQLVSTINETSDAEFRDAISQYLDLERFVRYVAVDMFLGDRDGFLGDVGMNNFYLYRLADNNVFFFIPWDKDVAFTGSLYNILHNISDVPDERRNRLMARAMAQPDLYALYLDTLLECARSVEELEPGVESGPGWLEREVQREYEQIRDAARADPARITSNDEFERAIQELLEIAHFRGEFVRRQVDDARR